MNVLSKIVTILNFGKILFFWKLSSGYRDEMANYLNCCIIFRFFCFFFFTSGHWQRLTGVCLKSKIVIRKKIRKKVCAPEQDVKCHTWDFTRFGGKSQPACRQTSSLVRKRLEAQRSCQLITCQKPLLMRGISLDPANIFRINLLLQGGSLDWSVFDIVETV